MPGEEDEHQVAVLCVMCSMDALLKYLSQYNIPRPVRVEVMRYFQRVNVSLGEPNLHYADGGFSSGIIAHKYDEDIHTLISPFFRRETDLLTGMRIVYLIVNSLEVANGHYWDYYIDFMCCCLRGSFPFDVNGGV